jgi:phage tail sheath gpL-like
MIGVLAQGNEASTYGSEPFRVLGGASEVGTKYGFGSPAHLAMLMLQPAAGQGVGSIPIYILPLASGTTAAASTVTPSGTITKPGTYHVVAAGQRTPSFVVPAAATIADRCTAVAGAIAAAISVPVTATDDTTDVGVTCKWLGETGNDITIEIVGPSDTGAIWGIAPMASGAANPVVASALLAADSLPITYLVNCLNITDTAALDAISAANESRWAPLAHRHFVSIVGDVRDDKAALIAFGTSRRTDRTTSVHSVPGTLDLPLMVAARSVAMRSVTSQESSALDAIRMSIAPIRPGPLSAQYNDDDREALVTAGISTTEFRGGVVTLSEGIMLYHPENDATPAYRHISVIVRLQEIGYNLALIFDSEGWSQAVLVKDKRLTTNPKARSADDAKAAIYGLWDALERRAVIVDAEFTKAGTTVRISPTDSDRLDIDIPDFLSGNTFKKSITHRFGFYFGG